MTIYKGQIIFAYANKAVRLQYNNYVRNIKVDDYIEAYGHWDVEEGIYCGISEINQKQVIGRLDVVLKYEDFNFYVMVPYKYGKYNCQNSL